MYVDAMTGPCRLEVIRSHGDDGDDYAVFAASGERIDCDTLDCATEVAAALNERRNRTLPSPDVEILADPPFVGPFTVKEFKDKLFEVYDCHGHVVGEFRDDKRAVEAVSCFTERWQRNNASKTADEARLPFVVAPNPCQHTGWIATHPEATVGYCPTCRMNIGIPDSTPRGILGAVWMDEK